MTDKKQRSGLGRGLSALMADVPESSSKDFAQIDVDQIHANPDQPRRSFPKHEMGELATSIREKGVIQPLILRPHPTRTGEYEIVAGERRWRAAQIARLHQVPAVIREFDDTEALEVAIIENIQRADLNPVDEAQAFRQLMQKFGHTQEQLSEALGKSRSHIANQTRLLSLPADVLEMLQDGRLTAGHARVLVPLEHASDLARRVVAQGLSVRQTEVLARKAPPSPKAPTTRITKDADTRALESDLSAAIGMNVAVNHKRGGAGSVTVSYADLEGLDAICRMLSSGSVGQ